MAIRIQNSFFNVPVYEQTNHTLSVTRSFGTLFNSLHFQLFPPSIYILVVQFQSVLLSFLNASVGERSKSGLQKRGISMPPFRGSKGSVGSVELSGDHKLKSVFP